MMMPWRKRNRHAGKLPFTATLCCMAGLVLGGVTGCNQDRNEESATPAPAKVLAASSNKAPGPQPSEVSRLESATSDASRQDSSRHPVPSTNMLDPHNYTTVGPLVVEKQADLVAARDGHVTTVSVEIGDHVRQGQVLALLDDRALQATRAEKAARIDSLRAQVETWEAEQKSNEADLRRADAMRAEKILDDEDWEHVQYKLKETTTEVARHKADEQAAVAELRETEVELGQLRITSPFDGVVGRRSVHEAQAVKKGDILFWITAQAPLRILFTVPESAMALFSRGAKLELTTEDFPHLKQPAAVYRVSPVVDAASGSVEVIGNLEKPSPLLKPGMSMQVKLSSR